MDNSSYLRMRSMAILFDVWRQIVVDRKIMIYRVQLIRIRQALRFFNGWKQSVMAECFHRFNNNHRSVTLFRDIVKEWYYHSITLRRKKEVYSNVIHQRKAYRSLRRWKNRWLRRQRLKLRFKRLRILHESRTLQSVLSAMVQAWKTRRRLTLSSIRSISPIEEYRHTPSMMWPETPLRLCQSLYEKKYVPTVKTHDLSVTFPSRNTVSLLGLKRR